MQHVRSPRLIFHLCEHQPIWSCGALRWPHGGHGDCARARRLWRASVGPRPAGARVCGRFLDFCVAAPPGAVSQANERTDGLKARGNRRGKWSHSDSRSLPWQGNASGNPPGSADSHKPWTLDKNKLTALFKTELPFAFKLTERARSTRLSSRL